MFHTDRRKACATAALAAALVGGAAASRAEVSDDAAHPAAARAPAVDIDIDITQDARHWLVVRYRAPDSVTHLEFLQRGDRVDSEVRQPLMKPANECGALVPGGIELRHGPGCEGGAVFEVQPRAMGLSGLREPAQPTGDGAVMLETGYYAAGSAGLRTRWHYMPLAGDYGIDEAGAHRADWTVETEAPDESARASADQHRAQAPRPSSYVFLGHTPILRSGGLLWILDPALGPQVMGSVGRASLLAADAFAAATGRAPEQQAVVVVMHAVAQGRTVYESDRVNGNLLRLSFTDDSSRPDARPLSDWFGFITQRIAQFWIGHVFDYEKGRPWLHEGDAAWTALNALHDTGFLPDAAFADQLQSRLDECLLSRGEHSAVNVIQVLGGDEEPFSCGVALHLLGFARVHSTHADATPLKVWGDLHRANPKLDTAGFARFFDGTGAPVFGPLLLDDKIPFASTYRADLAAYVPLPKSPSEPPPGASRTKVAVALMSLIAQADCDGDSPFGTRVWGNGEGEYTINDDARCTALPAGEHLTTLAGKPALEEPLAAWRAVRQSCIADGHVKAGFDGRPFVSVACPASMPGPPTLFILPDDALQRLGLKKNAS